MAPRPSLLLSLFLFLYSHISSAQTFLTYSEFYNLNPQKQIEYINSVRELAFSLESNPHLKVEIEKSQSVYVSMINQIINVAEASQLTALCDVQSATSYTDEQLLSKIENLMNCSEKSGPGQPNYFLQVVPQSAEVLSNEFKSRIESGRLNRRSRRVQEANGVFSSVASDIRNNVIIGGGNFQQQGQTISNNIQATEKLFLQKSTSRPVQTPQLKSANKKVQSKVVPAVKTDSPLLCLYAGFVISKNDQPRCQPMSRLPNSFDSSGFFDPATFECNGKVPVMCNPLLFGYESVCEKDELKPCYNKKPLCISRSSMATKNCLMLAKSKNTLPQVEDVWKSPNGENLYNEYVKSLESLCDSKNIESRRLQRRAKNDIIQTCKVAFEVFQDHVDRKFLPQKLQNHETQIQK